MIAGRILAWNTGLKASWACVPETVDVIRVAAQSAFIDRATPIRLELVIVGDDGERLVVVVAA